MNILSVIEVLGHGGAETVMVDLVAGLPEHRHLVWHFSRSNNLPVDRSKVRRLRSAGVEVRDVHWLAVQSVERREQELGDFRPDAVIFHWWQHEPWEPWVVGRHAEDPRPTFICVAHSTPVALTAPYDRYVLLADFQRETMSPAPAERVSLIRNAVDLDRFSAPSRALRSKAGQPLVIGTLGGLRMGKTPRSLVRDATRWAIPGAHWVIAGDGPLRAEFEREARTSRPALSVDFRGHVARRSVPRLLSGFDVLSHAIDPDVLDTNPIAVIEALAAGVPVVAERRGGLPELIEHGVNGLLADHHDGIGEHLRRLAADRGMVRRLAAGARAGSERLDRGCQLAAYRELLAAAAASRAT